MTNLLTFCFPHLAVNYYTPKFTLFKGSFTVFIIIKYSELVEKKIYSYKHWYYVNPYAKPWDRCFQQSNKS